MFARKYENSCNGCNKYIRISAFIILLCFQITVLSIYHLHMQLNAESVVRLTDKPLQNDNNIYNLSKYDLSMIFGFGRNEKLERFYYVPDSSSKRLYMWKQGEIVQVDASNILRSSYVKERRDANNPNSCKITAKNISSKVSVILVNNI